jgi:hypothetical protein
VILMLVVRVALILNALRHCPVDRERTFEVQLFHPEAELAQISSPKHAIQMVRNSICHKETEMKAKGSVFSAANNRPSFLKNSMVVAGAATMGGAVAGYVAFDKRGR